MEGDGTDVCGGVLCFVVTIVILGMPLQFRRECIALFFFFLFTASALFWGTWWQHLHNVILGSAESVDWRGFCHRKVYSI